MIHKDSDALYGVAVILDAAELHIGSEDDIIAHPSPGESAESPTF